MSKLLDNPAAYAAGIIDGEGCIRLIKYSDITYKVEVIVKMCKVESIRYIYDHFGGNIAIVKTKNPKHNDSYTWMLHGKNACVFLERVMPFLQVKRRHAEIAVLCGSTAEYSNSHFVPEDVVSFRVKCFEKLRELNMRGTSAAETEREDLSEMKGCDSPNCVDGKDTELPRNVEVEPEWV